MKKVCKRTRDYLVCRVNAGHVVLPIASKEKIPLYLYESPKCTLCPNLHQKLKTINKKLGKTLELHYIDIEKNAVPNDIIYVPSIKVGTKLIIGTEFDHATILDQMRYFNRA